MKSDSFHSITSSAKRFFTGTLLSRVSGMVREVLMAAFFGTDPSVSSFLIAFRFSNFFRRFLGEGAFQSSFIPHFESLRKESPSKAYHFFITLSKKVTLLLLLLILLIEIPTLLFPSFFPCSQGVKEIFLFSAFMLPGILFISLYTLNSALLQCEKIYFTPSFAPVLFNLTWIIALIFFSKLLPTKAMFFLTLIILLAYFLQWVYTLPQVHKILQKEKNPGNTLLNLKGLKKNLITSLIGVGAVQINSTLDFIFCRITTEVGPAYLAYSSRLYQLPLALFGISLAGALLPPLSRAIQQNDLSKYDSFLNRSLKNGLFVSLFCSSAIILFAIPCVNLIYGRGAFSQEDTWNTALTLTSYGVGFLPAVIVLILASAFYAKGNFKSPIKASLLSIATNILLNTLFIFQFRWQAAGVALATSIASFINLIALINYLKKENITIDWTSQLTTFLKTTLIALSAFFCAYLILPFSLEEILFIKKTTTFPTTFFEQLKLMFFPFFVYLTVFAFGAYLMKIKELSYLFKKEQDFNN